MIRSQRDQKRRQTETQIDQRQRKPEQSTGERERDRERDRQTDRDRQRQTEGRGVGCGAAELLYRATTAPSWCGAAWRWRGDGGEAKSFFDLIFLKSSKPSQVPVPSYSLHANKK